jgi:hypothetical protein
LGAILFLIEAPERIVAATACGHAQQAATNRLLAFARQQPLIPQPVDVNKFVAKGPWKRGRPAQSSVWARAGRQQLR